jgi:hypothetical protein
MAASNLVSSATLAGLLRCLVHKGVLQPAEIREVYETALMLLEQQQASVSTGRDAFIAARAALERNLQSRQGRPAGSEAKPW